MSGTNDEAMIKKFLQNAIGEGKTFLFRCTACGRCCRNREDILLSPYDVFRICQYLKMDQERFLQQYCVLYAGPYSRVPMVNLKMDRPGRTCPFLEDHKCRLQEAKPTVCALFPLGRMGQDRDKIVYFLQEVDCGVRDESHTVKEWMAGQNLSDSEECFFAWQDLACEIYDHFFLLEQVFSKEAFLGLVGMGFEEIYSKYDLEGPFLPQFRKKAEDYVALLKGLLSVYGLEGKLAELRGC